MMWPGDAEARLRGGIPLLMPAAALYGAGVAIVRARALRRRKGSTAGAHVISVGNLEVGGSGKTPLAAELLTRAIRAGKRTAYVSRGYRSRASRGPYATILLPDGIAFSEDLEGVRVIGREDCNPIEAEIGDEAALLAERLPGVILAVSARKQQALDAVLTLGAEVVVIDDGFSRGRWRGISTWSCWTPSGRWVPGVCFRRERCGKNRQPCGGRTLPCSTVRPATTRWRPRRRA